MAGFVEEIVRQDAAQPGQQFALMSTLERAEIAVRFQERLLHEIGRIDLGTQVAAELRLREDVQIVVIAAEQRLARCCIADATAFNQFVYGQFRRHSISQCGVCTVHCYLAATRGGSQ